MKDFFLDLAYLFGFFLRAERLPQAIAVCRRAAEELSLLESEEGGAEAARDQMRMVWQRLEEGVKRGTVEIGATAVMRSYIKANWKRPASEPPSF